MLSETIMATNEPYIAFAPLQGYTDHVYRTSHHRIAGGVDEYYTPFARLESGAPRKKDLRDTAPENNIGTPSVPQVIARNREEFASLCDILQDQGWKRIDLNMGCPFPMQVRAGRGSGLIKNVDAFKEIAAEIAMRNEVKFSIKMRLGQESEEEYTQLLSILNNTPLVHITMHPRLGKDQYKSQPNMTAFEQFCKVCDHPIVYNGDINDTDCLEQLKQRYPEIKGFMIGRGLLSKPWMFCEKEPLEVVLSLHRSIYEHAVANLCGDSQILSRLHAFWEYLDSAIDKKTYKAITKSGNLRNYREAVSKLAQR